MQTPPVPRQFWPESMVGWLTVLLGALGIAGAVWSYAKFMAHLNGLGDRTNKLESRMTAAEASYQEVKMVIARAMDQQTVLMEKILEAKHKAERAEDDEAQLRVDVLGYLAQFRQDVDKVMSDFRALLAKVETEVNHLQRGQRHV